jgi:chemotaxis response regulator CheB
MKILFIIDFSGNNRLATLFEGREDLQVYTEAEDGGRAYKLVGELLPDRVVVNMAAKPSHGLQTALSLKERKKTAAIPLFFVDVPEGYADRVAPLGNCVSMEALAQEL